ncbi:MAG: radical SAM protein [Gemmatimonadota bacterium]|nr:radical SAM protein [Gemmatimonadota bacterium]
MRYNYHGTLYSLVYHDVIRSSVEPIERIPLFHVAPGATAFTLGSAGCPLSCRFCQHWKLSQWPRHWLPKRISWEDKFLPGWEDIPEQLAELQRTIPGETTTPEEVIQEAKLAGCAVIAFSGTEPTTCFEFAHDIFKQAKKTNMTTVFATNGFINEGPIRTIAPVLDAVNISIKSFSEITYRRLTDASVKHVLEAIRMYKELGVWVEVSTRIIPGITDSDEELSQIARFIRSVDRDIPWHIKSFIPAYRMLDTPPTSPAMLARAREIGHAAGLNFVYAPGIEAQDTSCPQCGESVIERYGNIMLANRLVEDDTCRNCARTVAMMDHHGNGRQSP